MTDASEFATKMPTVGEMSELLVSVEFMAMHSGNVTAMFLERVRENTLYEAIVMMLVKLLHWGKTKLTPDFCFPLIDLPTAPRQLLRR